LGTFKNAALSCLFELVGLRTVGCSGELDEVKAFVFVCDEDTEQVCLDRKLVGTTLANGLWTSEIQLGDEIFLYNFQSGTIWGPFVAETRIDQHDATAWSGRFPLQVRIAISGATRKLEGFSKLLPRDRKNRPIPILDGATRAALVQQLNSDAGTPVVST
jgi:hypothetical protein